jgi:TetR/AcrR family transcriptional repressor of nem operon
MLSEMMADLPAGHWLPCCRLLLQDCFLAGSCKTPTHPQCWASGDFDRWLDSIVARYQPRILVDLDSLADMLSAITQGGIIVSKVVNDKTPCPDS